MNCISLLCPMQNHSVVSAASVNLTPSVNGTGEMSSIWTSLLMFIEMSAGDFTPRSIWNIQVKTQIKSGYDKIIFSKKSCQNICNLFSLLKGQALYQTVQVQYKNTHTHFIKKIGVFATPLLLLCCSWSLILGRVATLWSASRYNQDLKLSLRVWTHELGGGTSKHIWAFTTSTHWVSKFSFWTMSPNRLEENLSVALRIQQEEVACY